MGDNEWISSVARTVAVTVPPTPNTNGVADAGGTADRGGTPDGAAAVQAKPQQRLEIEWDKNFELPLMHNKYAVVVQLFKRGSAASSSSRSLAGAAGSAAARPTGAGVASSRSLVVPSLARQKSALGDRVVGRGKQLLDSMRINTPETLAIGQWVGCDVYFQQTQIFLNIIFYCEILLKLCSAISTPPHSSQRPSALPRPAPRPPTLPHAAHRYDRATEERG